MLHVGHAVGLMPRSPNVRLPACLFPFHCVLCLASIHQKLCSTQRYVHDKLINKTSAANTSPISLLHGSGISDIPSSRVPIVGALSFQQLQSFPPRPSSGAPSTRSKVRYSQEKSLSVNTRGLVQAADVKKGLAESLETPQALEPSKGQNGGG